jgi:hypothetical protein
MKETKIAIIHTSSKNTEHMKRTMEKKKERRIATRDGSSKSNKYGKFGEECRHYLRPQRKGHMSVRSNCGFYRIKYCDHISAKLSAVATEECRLVPRALCCFKEQESCIHGRCANTERSKICDILNL